jgi:dihydroflavonol-4-reductase
VGPGDTRPTATGRRILAALRGEPTPYPDGGINFIPVQDAAIGHLLAAVRGEPWRSYILGHPAGNLDQSGFLAMISEVAGIRLPKPPRRPAGGGQLPAALTVDPSRAIKDLGLPQSDLSTAFSQAVRYFRDRALA